MGANSSRVGGMIGGGFYLEMFKAYYPVPSRFNLADCSTSGEIIAGEGSAAVGTVIGYSYLCDTHNVSSDMEGDVIGETQAPVDMEAAAQ